MSESVAVFATTRVAGPVIVTFGCDGNIGGTFTSLTVTMRVLDAVTRGKPSQGLSVTSTVMTLVVGSCASLGVQVKTPQACPVTFVSGLGSQTSETLWTACAPNERTNEKAKPRQSP